MDLTQMTADQVTGLGDEALTEMRDHADYNAAIIENRNVISDGAHRIARHLRSLHHAADREIESRRKQPDGPMARPTTYGAANESITS